MADDPQFVPDDAGTMRKWGVDPTAVTEADRAPPLVVKGVRQPINGDDADTMRRWSVDPATVSDGSPIGQINAAAAKLGIAPNAPMQQKAAAVRAATRGRQQQIEGAAAVQDAPVTSSVMATTGNAINGIPIAGPLLESALQKSSAAARAAIYGTHYADELNLIKGAQTEATAKHPVLSTVGSIAGGVLGYGLAGSLGAAPALGLDGSLGQRVLFGGIGNAAVGGVDAAVRGNDPATEAAIGGVLGAAAPAAGKLIGKGIGAITSALSTKYGPLPSALAGIPRSAVNALSSMMHADDPGMVQSTLHRFGDDAMLTDAGPSLQGLAQGLAIKPGPAKSVLYNALHPRAAGAEARLNADINSALGPAEDPQAVTDAILAHRQAVDAQNYSIVHANAPPVDVSPVLAAIDRQLPTAVGAQRRALETFRAHMVAEPADPIAGTPERLQDNSEFLHNVRQEADAVINHDAPGLGVTAGAVARTQGALRTVRGSLDRVLKTQVPGMADADAASAALARRAEAVQSGTSVLSSGKTAQPPDAFEDAFRAMPPGEQIAQNKGLRGEINRIVGTNPNDVAAVRRTMQGEGGWNTAKLATSFGREPATSVVNALAREGAFSETMNKVIHNAQTGQRVGAAALLKDTDPGQYDFGKANITGLAIQGVKKIANPLINALLHTDNVPRDLAIARVLTAQGPARDAFARGLAEVAARRNALSVAGNSAGNLARMGTNFLIPSVNAGYQNAP